MSLTAAVLLLAAAPAAPITIAPTSPPDKINVMPRVELGIARIDREVEHDLGDALRSIEARRENGELSRREARALRREARAIATVGRRYARDGLTDGERGELRTRARVLRERAQLPGKR